ncbi:MAG: hypothetical protein U1F36_17205 [Planctomycetota bacterium]
MVDHAPPLPPDLTVGQLHNLLWTKSRNAAARELGCDPAWLLEFCTYTDIPVPNPEYWQRKRVGRRVNQRSLPKGLTGARRSRRSWRDAPPAHRPSSRRCWNPTSST